MVVSDDNRTCPVRDRVGKHFARVNRTAVDQPDGHDADVASFVRAIDRGTEKMLLFPVGVMSDLREQIGRRFDLDALWLDTAAGKLDRREKQRGLGVADALELRQIFALNIEPLLVDRPAPACRLASSHPSRRALAKQHGQQFLIAQRLAPFAQKLLARAILLRDAR